MNDYKNAYQAVDFIFGCNYNDYNGGDTYETA